VNVLGDLFERIAPFGSRQRTKPRRTTLERVLANVVALLREEAKAASVVIHLPEGDTPVRVDEADMQGIFRNLIENAIYWLQKVPAPERVIDVSVEVGSHDVSVIVSDNGPGVPEEVRHRIMEPYFTTRPEGAGLGLSLAGEIASEYEGALELLQDGSLSGAIFRVRLRGILAE
jgi:C4-dicarboxylate-specific signal transduction histidine kinase